MLDGGLRKPDTTVLSSGEGTILPVQVKNVKESVHTKAVLDELLYCKELMESSRRGAPSGTNGFAAPSLISPSTFRDITILIAGCFDPPRPKAYGALLQFFLEENLTPYPAGVFSANFLGSGRGRRITEQTENQRRLCAQLRSEHVSWPEIARKVFALEISRPTDVPKAAKKARDYAKSYSNRVKKLDPRDLIRQMLGLYSPEEAERRYWAYVRETVGEISPEPER